MRTRRLSLIAPIALTLFVSACGASSGTEATATSTATPSATAAATESVDVSTTDGTAASTTSETHEDASDYVWDEAAEVAITLSDGGSTATSGVTVEGSTVTITEAGTYRITGTLSSGQLAVDTDSEEVVRLVLDGVSITNVSGAAIDVVSADKVVIILADGSQNTLADGGTYTFPSADVDEPNAALFSAADLSIAGEGSLTVTGNYNDAITSKDGLVIAGGTITVTATDDGIRGKDYLVVHGGTLNVTAGGQALKSDNAEDTTRGYVTVEDGAIALAAGTDGINAVSIATVAGGSMTIEAGDDGIHSDAALAISGGTIDITRSYEGLEGTQIVISGGDVSVVAEDDGLNVAGGDAATAAAGGMRGGGPGGEQAVEGYFVEMRGGTLVIDAGGDGFDSNGSARVTGGLIVVNGPTGNGNGALDVNGEFVVSNATILAAGSAGMAEAPDGVDQAVLNVQFNATQPAGTVVTVRAADGTNVAVFQASKPFQSLVLTSPELVAGESYEVLTGGTPSGESTGGLYVDGESSGGTSLGSVTAR